MTENEISKIILDCAFKVHTTIGLELLERVYRECLAYELRKTGLIVEQEKPLPLVYEEVRLECGFRIDNIVEKQSGY
jgi:GxxExxY protein